LKATDFFAGTTLPVRDSFCTWINGGWGGEVAGLLSIYGADASMNETTFTRKCEFGRWCDAAVHFAADWVIVDRGGDQPPVQRVE
jgi:hypothetical protein